ncbi:hypothetical protein imdm_249 [gamma proteobacterium IMCC2047]|nr:hypothetical protein imdm_249 [gamma proteobacterium IMCC2047]
MGDRVNLCHGHFLALQHGDDFLAIPGSELPTPQQAHSLYQSG